MKVKTNFLVKKLKAIEQIPEKHELLVGDLMTPEVITARSDDVVVSAAEKMLENRIHALIVIDEENRPLGTIASYDLLLVMSISDYFDRSTKVGDVMVKDIITVGPKDSPSTALKKMIEYNIRMLGVVEDGRLVGILSLIDVAMAFADMSKIPLV